MSSWGHQPPPPRLGFYHDLPHGKFMRKETPATVVSAYYILGTNKWTKDQYKQWIEQFLQFPFHLVFFTSKELEPWISDCRKAFPEKTKIIVLPESEWVSTTNFPEDFWKKQHLKDEGKHLYSHEVYKVWYEKKEFVRKAIELNPWNHTDFVWADAGLCREPKLIPLLQRFPVADRIPIDRLLFNNTGPFTRRDETQLVVNKDRIGASVIAGSITSWMWFIEEYDRVLQQYIEQNLFCGVEQSVMASIIIQNKLKVSLLDAKAMTVNKWFYLFHYLGANQKLYNDMRNPLKYNIRRTVDEYVNLYS